MVKWSCDDMIIKSVVTYIIVRVRIWN